MVQALELTIYRCPFTKQLLAQIYRVAVYVSQTSYYFKLYCSFYCITPYVFFIEINDEGFNLMTGLFYHHTPMHKSHSNSVGRKCLRPQLMLLLPRIPIITLSTTAMKSSLILIWWVFISFLALYSIFFEIFKKIFTLLI